MESTLLTILGSLVVALLSVGGLILSSISTRLRHVEVELDAEKANNRLLWTVYRDLLDMYYKWRRDDAPPPPAIPKEIL